MDIKLGVYWIIPMKDEVEWVVNWEELYGELSAGYYRIRFNNIL